MDVVRQYWLWRLRNAYLMANALRAHKQRVGVAAAGPTAVAKPDEISGPNGRSKLIPADREAFQDTAPLVFHPGTENSAGSCSDNSEPQQQR